MFVTDFQVSQGVLFVDTALITANHIAESPPANEFNFLCGNYLQGNLASTEVLPGDAPVLKFQSKFIVQVLPGDAPVLKT